MSAFHHTPSPNDMATAKVKDPWQCTEEDWMLVLEAKLNPVSSNDEGIAQLQKREKKRRLEVWRDEHRQKQDEKRREAEERRACEEAAKKAWEEAKEVHKVQEEAEKKERKEREAARTREAAEAWANAEQRAVEERLWNVAAQCSEMAAAPPWVAKPGERMSVAGPSTSGWRASGVQDPCTQCCNKGTHCILGIAKGKTMACEACHHVKVSCSWTRKMTGEAWKRKQVCHLEEAEDVEIVEVDEGNEDNKVWSHFAVPPHLVEDHQDTLGALTMTLDTLSMEFYEFQRDYWGFGMEVLKVMDTITQELKRAN
ncbi:hypothetical protein ID866_13232, partial [Astraeus odoratus]